MSQPEYLAAVHTPEVAAKRGQRRREWFAAGSPAAEAERARIAGLNPMSNPVSRAKVSATLRAMGHRPSIQGGNGRGPTLPQKQLHAALGEDWEMEYAVSLGPRTAGYPTAYKVDIGNSRLKVAVEVDGVSHQSPKRRAEDVKRDEKLTSLGWTVLRFTNKEILTSTDTVAEAVRLHCMTLK